MSEQNEISAVPETVVPPAVAEPDPTAAVGPSDAASPTTAGSATSVRGDRKVREGLVVSDKMKKTIVVELEDRVKHPRYSKVIRRTSKVKAHDADGLAGIGDRVLLAETRPMSATKRWRLVQIVEKAK